MYQMYTCSQFYEKSVGDFVILFLLALLLFFEMQSWRWKIYFSTTRTVQYICVCQGQLMVDRRETECVVSRRQNRDTNVWFYVEIQMCGFKQIEQRFENGVLRTQNRDTNVWFNRDSKMGFYVDRTQIRKCGSTYIEQRYECVVLDRQNKDTNAWFYLDKERYECVVLQR